MQLPLAQECAYMVSKEQIEEQIEDFVAENKIFSINIDRWE